MFKKTQRFGTQTVWVHAQKPVWLVYYEAIKHSSYTRPAFYQGYKSVCAPKKEQKPWAVDNRMIGHDEGFRTLRDAMRAGELA